LLTLVITGAVVVGGRHFRCYPDRRSSFASVSQAEENKVGKGEVMVRQGEEVVLFFTPVEDLSNTDFFSNIGGTRIDEAICT